MKIKNIHLTHFRRTDITVFKHRLSLFCTLDFIILSLIAFGCICLLIFIIRCSFIVSGKEDNAGNDIYTVLVNLSSGFLTGYLVYFLGEKIPIYNKIIRNEHVIEFRLAEYSSKFIEAFSLLVYTNYTNEMDYLKNIPEIQYFLDKDKVGYNHYLVQEFKNSHKIQDKLIEEFQSLEDTWNKLCEIVCVVDTPVTTIVTNLESNCWRYMLTAITMEISQKLDQFHIIKTGKELLLSNVDLIRYEQYIK